MEYLDESLHPWGQQKLKALLAARPLGTKETAWPLNTQALLLQQAMFALASGTMYLICPVQRRMKHDVANGHDIRADEVRVFIWVLWWPKLLSANFEILPVGVLSSRPA